jgi:hypothetical protein
LISAESLKGSRYEINDKLIIIKWIFNFFAVKS